MKKFALSIKGGFAHGFGSIGLIRYLQEENLRPEIIGASSAGSMVASMYALGFSWQEMLEAVDDFNILRVVSLTSLLKDGSLFSQEAVRAKMLQLLNEHKSRPNPSQPKLFNKLASNIEGLKIEDMPVKLVFFGTDPIKQQRVFIDKGSLLDGILASSALPGIIKPFAVNKRKVILDGDLSSSFSTTYLRGLGAEVIIGVRGTGNKPVKRGRIALASQVGEMIRLVFDYMYSMDKRLDPPDLIVEFSRDGHTQLDMKSVNILARRAYKQALLHSDEIKYLLK